MQLLIIFFVFSCGALLLCYQSCYVYESIFAIIELMSPVDSNCTNIENKLANNGDSLLVYSA